MFESTAESRLHQRMYPRRQAFACVELLLRNPDHQVSLAELLLPSQLRLIRGAAIRRLRDEEESAEIAKLGYTEIGQRLADPRPIYEASIAKLKSLIAWLETELERNLR